MSLLDVQNFTARLYTDENLRREFSSAPERIGKINRLNEGEIAELAAAFLSEEIDFFADTLLHKRMREVEKILPLTRQILETDFDKYFREFAARFAPESIKKHLEDAIAFADFLQNKTEAPFGARDAAKFERTKLEFNNSEGRFAWKVFDCDVREFARRNRNAPFEIRRRKTLAIWFRFGGAARHFVW